MPKFKHELGVQAEDKITGFKGVITSRVEYLTGCNQYGVAPKAKDGDYKDTHYFDEERLKITSSKQVIKPEEVRGSRNGGPDRGAPRK